MEAGDRYRRVKMLFLKAVDLGAFEREALLSSACAGDADLRAAVDNLLAAADETSGGEPRAEAGASPDVSYIGRTIGRYTIRRLIAVGGMGAVFEALQERPRRVVALKLMRRGCLSRAAQRRFKEEAEILGRLRHPGIAQVYEAGTHDDGTGPVPFFAMEYIPGARSLTEHAEERSLGVRERLELFAGVCDAVHHGHQRGIIHRDLKPSNILVDASGLSKVIDFGVARLTDSDIAATTMRTDVGQLIGTIRYMSPEQCEADSYALDTRSDVYSLGVVLYELLCGCAPYDLGGASIIEATRIIRQSEPHPPSRVRRVLRGDVETITLKALAKERDARYRSAAELGDDIRRFLRNEPIIARPPTMAYYIVSCVRRNPVQVAAGTVILATLVVATAVSLVFAEREHRQRMMTERAFEDLQAVVDFQEGMLGELEPNELGRAIIEDLQQQLAELEGRRAGDAGDRPPRAPDGERTGGVARAAGMLRGVDKTGLARRLIGRDVLGRALETLGRSFEDRPYVQGKLRLGIGRTYAALGMYGSAQQELETAVGLLALEPPATARDVTVAMLALADVRYKLGLYESARELYESSRARAVQVRPPMRDLEAHALTGNGACLGMEGDLDSAERVLLQAQEVCDRLPEGLEEIRLGVAAALFDVYLDAGRFEEAEPLIRFVLEQRLSAHGDEHPASISAKAALGRLYSRWGRYDLAEPLLSEALALDRQVRGAEHEHTFMTTANYAECLLLTGRADEAQQLLDRMVVQARRRPAEHWSLGHFLVLQADCRAALGPAMEAEPLYREGYDVLAETLGAGHHRTLEVARTLAALYEALGRLEDAQSWASRAGRSDDELR